MDFRERGPRRAGAAAGRAGQNSEGEKNAGGSKRRSHERRRWAHCPRRSFLHVPVPNDGKSRKSGHRNRKSGNRKSVRKSGKSVTHAYFPIISGRETRTGNRETGDTCIFPIISDPLRRPRRRAPAGLAPSPSRPGSRPVSTASRSRNASAPSGRPIVSAARNAAIRAEWALRR